MIKKMIIWLVFNVIYAGGIYYSYLGNQGATNIMNVWMVFSTFTIFALFFDMDGMVKKLAETYTKLPAWWGVFTATWDIVLVLFCAYNGWYWWTAVIITSSLLLIEARKQTEEYLRKV